MKKIMLGMFAVLLLALPFCIAEDIVIDIKPVNNRIISGEWAVLISQ
ncbi:MAG: hypothetical protein KKE20_00295 [Nanoarchaeota archaeon]|nr:hypothetical protein [Nanoarchaeota archaeon]